jgi:tryptophan synthase beta chain
MLGRQYGRLPDVLTACVGGGSNAIGLFHAFLNDRWRAALSAPKRPARASSQGRHAASLSRRAAWRAARQPHLCAVRRRRPDHRNAFRSPQGLDYPGVGPEHAFLKDTGRAELRRRHRRGSLAAFHLLARTEGILPALESSHAVAQAIKLARDLPKDAAGAVQPVRPRRQGRAHHRRREGITL